MIASLGIILGSGTALQLGSASGSPGMVWLILQLFCAVFGTLAAGGLIADHRFNKELTLQQRAHRAALNELARKYNDVTSLLESNFQQEKRAMGIFSRGARERLRQRYESLYLQNKSNFEKESLRLVTNNGALPATAKRFKTFWKSFVGIGLICQMAACSYTTGTVSSLSESPEVAATRTNSDDATGKATTEWTAESVPMPHLTDGSRYVSNPDGVVTPHTESLLNETLRRMDDSLQIESAMIIVNHVEGQDIFQFAQDIFDRYHVGKNDRGLVVVLAYGDHLVRSHTGRALEADLTDIECSRLQQTYAIPFMKSEQPDSGMLYLAEAIYSTLKGKDLPLTASQKKEAEADETIAVVGIYMLLFGVWALLIGYLAHRYRTASGMSLLRDNPFVEAPVIVMGGRGFGGGQSFGGGGGGFGGGGFSGGSSGGGGATSGW